MQKPLVSILISVYNAGQFLRPSVKSILKQTYRTLEIIIIDDGSTDGCMDSIADIKDSRVTILRQENAGKSVALNKALEVVSGDFYAIQDADDLSYPTRIERLIEAMADHPQLAGVFSGYDLIINDQRLAPRFREKDTDECQNDIKHMRMPSHDPTVMYRMSMVKDFIYAPELRIGQGWDYILRVGEKYPLKVIGECLYSYRINAFSNTRSDTDQTYKKSQMVIARAYERRKKIYAPVQPQQKINKNYGVVPHFMESVLDLRKTGKYLKAFKTALCCAKLCPFNVMYYKPLIYCLVPTTLISYYRKVKSV